MNEQAMEAAAALMAPEIERVRQVVCKYVQNETALNEIREAVLTLTANLTLALVNAKVMQSGSLSPSEPVQSLVAYAICGCDVCQARKRAEMN